MLRRKAVAALAGLLALGLARGAAGGEGDAKHVTVTARGQATTVADSVEVEFTVTAHTEECVEAEKKFRDKLARVEKALKEGEPTAAPKKKSSDDDEDDAPKKKTRPKVGASAAPGPPSVKPPANKKRKKPADDDDDDETPAPKKKSDAKKDDSKDDDSGDDSKKDASKKDDSKKEDAKPKAEKSADTAGSIAVVVTERNLSISVKSSKVEENGLARVMAGRMGVQPEKNDSPMYFTCKVVATIDGVKGLDRTALCKRIAQLIDLGIDQGADGSDGDAPVVRFLCREGESLRKAAYKDAMKRAKDRASELADLAGRSLGGVASVQETAAPVSQPKADDASSQGEKVVAMIYGLKTQNGATVVPTMDLEAEVELRVDFELK